MSGSTESEARKALARFSRALEKASRELDGLEGALRTAEGGDFPADVYRGVRTRMEEALRFAEEEGQRLQEKVLTAGGLEPGRVRRSGGLGGGGGDEGSQGRGEQGPEGGESS